jgi:hypothetical protein
MASCCTPDKNDDPQSTCACQEDSNMTLKPEFPTISDPTVACCGAAPADRGTTNERPGYHLWGFVEAFMQTAAGVVPQVHTRLTPEDRLGTVMARLGIGRDRYRIAPGLYALGQPADRSPVMVTANYKLTFDTLRSHLGGVDAWILVIDTKNINVWCAAGKGTFSSREVAERVKSVGLEDIVSHRRLILPQLAATGVSARQVRKMCGFEVVWGPVHAQHIDAFLEADMQASPAMRTVTFSLKERVELIPVELKHLGKPTLYLLPALLLLSGLGAGFFSISDAFYRGMPAVLAYGLAVVGGAILAPILLPWLPGSAFAVKGAAVGMAAGALLSALLAGHLTLLEMAALTVFIMAISSYLAMNFTGSTPYTSPTGVEKEMRKAIPAQAAGALVAVIFWVSAGFMGR